MTTEAVQVQGQESAALATMTLSDVKQQVALIQTLLRGAMQKDQHYGVIPGCGDKPTLLKPGAEKICMMFRLIPSYRVDQTDLPGGHREYRVTCRLTHGPTGTPAGEGLGCCSTMESKYRFRWEDTGNLVPQDYWKHRDHELLGGESYVPRKSYVNGKQVWKIFHRVEHDNPADYYNTVLKIGKKRGQVDATLTATAASDIFTQDVEDLAEVIPPVDHAAPIAEPQAQKPKGEAQPPPPQTQPATDASATPKTGGVDIVVFERVTRKFGPEKEMPNGKKAPQWTLYTGYDATGAKYATFKGSHGDLMLESEHSKKKMTVAWKPGKRDNERDILAIGEADPAADDIGFEKSQKQEVGI